MIILLGIKSKKFSTGQLKHSYLLSNNISNYKIAKVLKRITKQKKKFYGKSYIKLDINNLKKKLTTLYNFQVPRKSSLYLINI